MHALLAALNSRTLAQQEEILQGIRRGLNAEPAAGPWLALLIGALCLLALLVLAKKIHGRERLPNRQPQRDYLAEALKVLGLDQAERDELVRLARRAHLAQPAAILLSPGNLAAALERSPGGGGDAATRQRVNALSVKLFGQPLPEAPTGRKVIDMGGLIAGRS